VGLSHTNTQNNTTKDKQTKKDEKKRISLQIYKNSEGHTTANEYSVEKG
jgi:hypothetical protein